MLPSEYALPARNFVEEFCVFQPLAKPSVTSTPEPLAKPSFTSTPEPLAKPVLPPHLPEASLIKSSARVAHASGRGNKKNGG